MLQKPLHILGKPGREFHGLPCHGMGEPQTVGVQGLAADMAVIRMIEEIPGQGMAYGFHMDPYLVGPPCFQREAD